MTENEFKTQLHNKICDMSDLLLYYYDFCQIKQGKCVVGSPEKVCCSLSRFYKEDGSNRCPFLGERKCLLPNAECKVFLCSEARVKDEKGGEAMRLLEKIAILYDYFK